MPPTPPATPRRPHVVRDLGLRTAGLYVIAGLAWMVGAQRGGGLLAAAVALIFMLAFVASAAAPALALERRWIRASMACALASFLAAWVFLLAVDAVFSPAATLGCQMHEVSEGGLPDAVCTGPLPLFSSGFRAWFLLPVVAFQAATTAFGVAVVARGVRLAVRAAARLAGWRLRPLPRGVAQALVLLGWIVPGALLAAALLLEPVREARAERREAAAEVAQRNRGPSTSVSFRTAADSLEVGDDERLVASASYSRGGGAMAEELDSVRLDFASLAPRVASVDSAGMLHALAPGTARITVTAHALGTRAQLAEGKADTVRIRVAPPNAALRTLRFVSVAASPSNEFGATCAVGSDGAAYCWGYSIERDAEEGDGGPRTFARVAGPEPFAAVSVGGGHRCAVARSGRGYCWGDNAEGQLGIGSRRQAADAPTPIAGGHGWRQISAGWRHTCGIDVAGALFCWGSDMESQLAPAAIATRCPSSLIGIERSRRERWRCALQPAPILARVRFLEVGTGDSHTCALAVDRAVWCWGGNYNHQSSPGAAQVVPVPARIPLPPMAHLAAGTRHNCGVATDGRLVCWGFYRYGETPDEDPGRGPRRPLPVDSVPPLRALAEGESHGCGIAVDGRAWCWGNDFDSALGRGVSREREPSAAAVAVAGGLHFQSIAAGHSYTCAVTVRGGLYCWGSGLSFRFAGGNHEEIPQPFRLAGPPG